MARVVIVQERYTDGRQNGTDEYPMLPSENYWQETLRRTRYARHHTVFDIEGPDGDGLLVTVYPAVHRIAVSVQEV